MNPLSEMLQYYQLLQDELLYRKRTIDTLIESRQRYSKGIMCEELLRRFFRDVLPNDLAIAHGFIYHSGRKSPQCDIIIYNRAKYSPFLCVNDLVIVPAEAVIGIIEVKTHLNGTELQKTLTSFRSIHDLCQASLGYCSIMAYLVGFESISLKALLRNPYLNPFPSQLEAIVVLGKGFIFTNAARPPRPTGYLSKDALIYLVIKLLSRFYFMTGVSGTKRNPYEAHIDQLGGERIDIDAE